MPSTTAPEVLSILTVSYTQLVMDEIFDKMIGGEAAGGVYYSGDAITMIDDNPDLAWVFPEEGSVLSVDCMTIPAASEHQEAAEMFINFMCETDIGKANAEYIGYTDVYKRQIISNISIRLSFCISRPPYLAGTSPAERYAARSALFCRAAKARGCGPESRI